MGASGSKKSKKERQFLLETYELTPEKFDAIREVFKERAGKKNYLNFQDFCELYDCSRFEHDAADQLALFEALIQSDRMTLASFVHLCQLCEKGGKIQDTDRQRVLFNVMDSDRSGTISEAEFCRFLANFVDDEATMQHFFARADEDESKLIDFTEFSRFCRNHKRAYKLMCAYVFPVGK